MWLKVLTRCLPTFKLNIRVLCIVSRGFVRDWRLVWDCVKLQTYLSSLSLMLAILNFVHVLTAAVCIAKVCKMMTLHFRTLLKDDFDNYLPRNAVKIQVQHLDIS